MGVNLKFGVNPSSQRQAEENISTESKQDLQITIFRAIKKGTSFQQHSFWNYGFQGSVIF